MVLLVTEAAAVDGHQRLSSISKAVVDQFQDQTTLTLADKVHARKRLLPSRLEVLVVSQMPRLLSLVVPSLSTFKLLTP